MIDKVYLLWQRYDYEGNELQGVFISKDNAESYADHLAVDARWHPREMMFVEEYPLTDNDFNG